MDINNLWSEYDLNSKKQNSRCLAVNTILEGKYLIGPVLGQGGFGITYVGYDLNMEAKIAIKEYFPVELVSRDTTTMHGDRVLSLGGEKSVTYKSGLKKYVAEAQNVSQFSEIPGVVSVKDFFYANETAYIVMEFIDGISLKEYLKEKGGRLTEEETLKIMKPILEALVQVHKSGIIHRDISPDNIMLTFEDRNNHNKIQSVKLIDFGAARMTERNDQKSLTIILKHGYAPEEQYRTHGEQGPWTDVYALCAVLYRMLTGETPVPAMDRMFQDELKKFEQCGVKVSANTANAILKGLAVKKDDRIQSVQELIGALYEGTKVNAATVGKGKRVPAIAGAGIAILAAVSVVFAGGIMGGRSDNQETTVMQQSGGEVSTETSTETPTEETEAPTEVLKESVEEEAVIEFIDVKDEEEEIGEQIVEWNPQTSICVKMRYHTLICKPDGSVTAMGGNEYGQCMVQNWDHIVAVASSTKHSLGLRLDGRVFAAGNNEFGECEVETWSDIIAIAAGTHRSYGLKKDGTVVVSGNSKSITDEISKLQNIKAIEAYENVLYALDQDGVVHTVGGDEAPKITGWNDVEYMALGTLDGFHLLGITADGQVLKAEFGKLSGGDSIGSDSFSGVENWKNIQQIGSNTPVLAVKMDGTVVCLDQVDAELKEEIQTWTDMASVASVYLWDRIFIIGLKNDGTIVQYRQNLGNTVPEEMKNLEQIQIMNLKDENLIGKMKDGNYVSYGLSYNMSDSYIEKTYDSVKNSQSIIGSEAVLTDDGQLILFESSYSIGDRIVMADSGVVDAIELWNGSYNGGAVTYGYALLKEDQTVEIAIYKKSSELEGTTPNLIYGNAKSAENWENVVQIIDLGSGVLCGLHEDGTISTTSEQNQEKLKNESGLKKIAGKGELLLGIREDNSVAVLLSGDLSVQSGKTQVDRWTDIQDIVIGESHVVGLRADGTVVAAGNNQNGQCDVEEWENIVSLAAGKNSTFGITRDGELKMAGSLY